MSWRDPRRWKQGLSSKEGGFQNGLATRGPVMVMGWERILRSLTQIENVSTKREQFVVISLTIAFPLKGYPLSILKIERMTTLNENG